MRPNVFLRSTSRQPVRSIFLLVITALLTFAFVSKGAEYLLIKQETEDLSGYYRSIGTLSAGGVTANLEADASEAADWLEANPYVELVDRVQTLSAVTDVYNADTNKPEPANMAADIYFYGTYVSGGLQYVSNNKPAYSFLFQIDSVLTGYSYPDYLIGEGHFIALLSPREYLSYQFVMTPYGLARTWAQSDPYADLTDLYEELQAGGEGQCYLLHMVNETLLNSDNAFPGTNNEVMLTMRPLTEDGLWCYPVGDGEEADFSDPVLAGVAEAIRRADDNQHALLFFGSEDVSAMPGLQKDAAGNATILLDASLAEGRWPDAQDNAEGNRVCAIHSKLAEVRDLSVGDTITAIYRELLDMSGAPYLCKPEDLEREDEMEVSEPITYEIVGIYETTSSDEPAYNYLYNYVYVPVSTMPQSMLNTSDAVSPYYFSFVLTSPEVEDQFIVEAREALSAMGFQARFLPTSYDAFQAVARPMRQSALYNAVIFSIVLVAALCLVVFLYFRMRRKDLAIARALGVPVRQCVRQASVPLLLIGLLSILAGGYAGWRYTLENAGQTLSALAEIIEETGAVMTVLSVGWLVLLLAACFVPLLLLTLGGAAVMARKPVLDQLQGGTAAKEKRTAALAERDAAPIAPVTLDLSAARMAPAAVPASGRGISAGMTLRFVWRHISRAKLKTVLSILLAAVFTVALAAIRISIADNEEKIDRLYDETIVEADLLYAHSDYARLGSGFIQDKTFQAILDTGYVLTASPEGVRRVTVVLTVPSTQEEVVGTWYIRSFEHEDLFLSDSGGGSAASITYCEGWDGSLFAADWEEQEGPIPAVLPVELYEAGQFQPGDTFVISCGRAKTFVAAGYYEGTVADMYIGTETPILIPLSAHRLLLNNLGLLYARARLTLDPNMNRELETVETAIQEAANQKSVIKLQTIIWDQELKLAVTPLENNVELMRVLYPVILALSLLAAAGIAALFIMTSAKEAAIMRVLGTTKLHSRVMLSLQQVFTTMTGLAAGILAALAWSKTARPELLGNLMGASALCAVLYLLAAIIGAAVSSSAATGKNPLELLQVKE